MNVHETVEIGINNTYRLLSKECTLEDIVEECLIRGEENGEEIPPIFFIEPGTESGVFELDLMIEYFEDLEEYEKCGTLLKLKTK